MNRSVIVSKGKNVKEAIDVGLELLGATKQEVDIEIIELETKVFLGIAKGIELQQGKNGWPEILVDT